VDIGEAPDVALCLNALDNQLPRPIYSVLDNQNIYQDSIAGVRELSSHLPPHFGVLSGGGVC